jgi:hypothetical protein
LRHNTGLAAATIREFSREDCWWTESLSRLAGSEPVHVQIEAAFPDEIAEICRHCLRNPEWQHGYFDHNDLSGHVFDFAIDVIAEWGNVTDIPLLQAWSRDSRVGKTALTAIAKLENAQALETASYFPAQNSRFS